MTEEIKKDDVLNAILFCTKDEALEKLNKLYPDREIYIHIDPELCSTVITIDKKTFIIEE